MIQIATLVRVVRPARMPLLALLGLLSLSVFAWPAAAQEPNRKAVEDIVREYLLKNPEVIRDAMLELENRQRDGEKLAQKKALTEQKAAIFNDPASIVVGNPNGDVTLVEFFDYNCGFCKRSIDDVQALIKADPKLRVVLRDFPILGDDSVEASRIAVAAKAQLKGDKLWEFHAKLMGTKARVGKDRALEVAKEMGLDLARINAEAGKPELMQGLQRTMEVADAIGLSGTPVFVVADEIIAGAVGVQPLRKAVESIRACGKVSC